MELRQLRYLIAVVQEANFTRAAEQVFVTQSALSQQIQALEQEVGAVLLERSRRGVRLTAAGEILVHHAQRIFLELEQARVALEELSGLQRGELRVGVVQTVNEYFMPSLVTAFVRQYPQVRLLVEELPADGIEARLEDGSLQIGLGFIPSTSAHIASEHLFEEELVLIVRADHDLSQQTRLAVGTLDDVPMVMLSHTFCTRRLWEENARLAEAQPRIVMEMNTVSSILTVVEKTGLATILPRHTLMAGWPENLVSIALTDPTPSREVGLLWSQDAYLCTTSRAFMALAQQTSQALMSAIETA